MIVLKIGGSLLTDKLRYRELRHPNVVRLAREVASAEKAVALVHGAGSFGHVVAKEHELANGRRGDRAQDAGAARVGVDVRELDHYVLHALGDAGARPIAIPGFAVARLRAGELASFDAEPFRLALAAGLLPVTFGDLAPDLDRGFGIVSGDSIVEALAKALAPERVVIATDVEGLYDRPPMQIGAKLLREVTADEAVAALAGGAAGGSTGVDVTGGMAGKLARLAPIARAGTPVFILNGNAPGRLAGALAGKAVEGTTILLG